MNTSHVPGHCVCAAQSVNNEMKNKT